jgi:phosphoribosylanthranilate isomerase
LKATEAFIGKADMFLFDTPTPAVGGSGHSFDWSLLAEYEGETPFLLSGGIGPKSIDALNAFSHPKCLGIDHNSCFETAPGMKDVELLKTFIKSIRTK